MAYLNFVKSGGKTYVYVNEYVGEQEYSQKKEKKIVRLGRIEQAFMTLKVWQIDSNKIPLEINRKDHERIPLWIDKVRNRGAY